jgi:hypothetical protein
MKQIKQITQWMLDDSIEAMIRIDVDDEFTSFKEMIEKYPNTTIKSMCETIWIFRKRKSKVDLIMEEVSDKVSLSENDNLMVKDILTKHIKE